MRIRLPALASPLAACRWPALIALLAFLAVGTVRFALGDLLSGSDPKLSLVFDPSQSGARVAVSKRLFLEDASRFEDAITGARQALADNPFSPDAFTLLARASQEKGDNGEAALLMTWASEIDRRDLESQLWLLDQDLRNARTPEALERVDILLRGQPPQVLDRLTPTLAPILTSEAYRSGFGALLRANPPWRSFWLRQMLAHSDDLSGLNKLFDSMQAEDNPPTAAELAAFLNRFVGAGLFDQAYIAWTKALPLQRLGKQDYLYNARFRYPLTNLPFDWVFASTPQALIAVKTTNEARILNVDFFGGRVAFDPASHLLKLAPGPYRFSGQERSESLQNDRGLRWRLFCAAKPAETLGTTELMTGETLWREFDVDFVVPQQDCSFQKLVLELPARVALETEILGRVFYRDLDIRPR
jgi:hypothetical protein